MISSTRGQKETKFVFNVILCIFLLSFVVPIKGKEDVTVPSFIKDLIPFNQTTNVTVVGEIFYRVELPVDEENTDDQPRIVNIETSFLVNATYYNARVSDASHFIVGSCNSISYVHSHEKRTSVILFPNVKSEDIINCNYNHTPFTYNIICLKYFEIV